MKRNKQGLFIALIYITAALIILNILKEVFDLDIAQAPRLGGQNMRIKWTQQEDNLLRQLDALGYSSSKIYKEYGSINGCPIAEEQTGG